MTTQLLMTAWDQHPHTYDPVRRPIVLSLSRPPIYRQPPERAAELATSPPGRVRSIAISMPVCLRLSARISHERHVQKTLRVHDFCSCGSILL